MRRYGKTITTFTAIARKHGPDKKFRVCCFGTSEASAKRMAAMFRKIEPSYIYELDWTGKGPIRGCHPDYLTPEIARALLEDYE